MHPNATPTNVCHNHKLFVTVRRRCTTDRRRSWSRRVKASLHAFSVTASAVTPAVIGMAAGTSAPNPLAAQSIFSVSGEYGIPATLQTFNLNPGDQNPLVSETAILGIPTTHRVRGTTPFVDGIWVPNQFTIYTEMSDGTSHLWVYDTTTNVAIQHCSPLHWPGGTTLRSSDMVGIARTPLPGPNGLPTDPWHGTMDQHGLLLGPIVCSPPGFVGPGSRGLSGKAATPSYIRGFMAYLNGIYALGHNAAIPATLTTPAATSSPTLMMFVPPPANSGDQTIINPSQAWILPPVAQVLGSTISEEGIFYAIVNQITDTTNHSTGYVELIRSTSPLDGSQDGVLEVVRVGSPLQFWDTNHGGMMEFPPTQLIVPEEN